MDNPNLIDQTEREIEGLIDKAHGHGMNYWQLLDLFLRAVCNLHCQAGAEYRIKQGVN